MAELHLAKDSGHKNKHYFGHLSGEIRGEKLYEDGIGGLGKVDQEVDLLHLFFHVGQRQDAEGRGVVHPDKVVVIRTVLGQWGAFPAGCPDFQDVLSCQVVEKLCSRRTLHPGQLLLHLRKEHALHFFTRQPLALALQPQLNIGWLQPHTQGVQVLCVDPISWLHREAQNAAPQILPGS